MDRWGRVVPVLKTVWFWPSGGGLVDPEEDAFVRTAGRVGEAYSAAIAKQRIASRHSEVRCFVSHDASVDSVQVHVHVDGPAEGFLGGRPSSRMESWPWSHAFGHRWC